MRAASVMGSAAVAWMLWGLSIALTVTIVVLGTTVGGGGDAPSTIYDLVVSFVLTTTFPTVGAAIASRRTDDPIGWILLGIGLTFGTAILAGGYAQYGLVVEPGGVPGARWAAWVSGWIWPVALAPIGLVLLFFPDGEARSRWARAAVLCLAASLIGWWVSTAFAPGGLANAGYPDLANPLGVRGLGAPLEVVQALSGIGLLVGVLVAIVDLIARSRGAQGRRRYQFKWLAYAAALVGLTAIVSLALESIGEADGISGLLQLSLVASISTVPITIGIAMLRHNLYDIDRLINRTIVYVLVTGMLVASYAATVFVTSTVAFGSGDDLTVALGTLIAAGLFRPVLRRTQGLVDRRFDRRKYDARQTVDAFGARLREEVDLDELTDDLVGVVRTAMGPAHVSLWLRSDVGPIR